MRTYDIYGFVNVTMAEVKAGVEAAANTVLAVHDSSYRGGEYYRVKTGDEEIILQQNKIEHDEWAEEEFKEFPMILYIARTERGDELKNKVLGRLASGKFLRRNTL